MTKPFAGSRGAGARPDRTPLGRPVGTRTGLSAVPCLLLAASLLVAGCSSAQAPEPTGAPGGSLSVEEQTADLARSLNITDPPDVEPVRVVAPEDRGPLVEACLAEEGYSSASEQGIPTEQIAAYDLASFVCLASYPVDPRFTGTWGERQTTIQYDWTVEEVIPCLAAAGYTTTGLPSREVFLATWSTDPFYPFAQVPPGSLSNEALEDLNRRCPQTAPSELLWGAAPAGS